MPRKRLTEYERKRSFERTPEPRGGGGEAATEAETSESSAAGGGRFVVQEHHASSLHWDLRLERDGVAVSWALPKGLPPHPKENRLAVHTEDHPLEYLDFEGEIPKGEYGAGTMSIWDSGTYEAEEWTAEKVTVTLRGERVAATFGLFPTNAKNWMIHRMSPPEDPGRVPMPERVEPMLATLGDLPTAEEGWAYELKWDGVRAVAHCDSGHLRLHSRTGREITATYPEVRPLAAELGMAQAVLDGELVAFTPHGRPDFQRLQGRMNLSSEAVVRRRVADTPVTYVIFDLLFWEGRELYELPYADRRGILARLELEGPSWQTPAHRGGDGAALLALTEKQGLEGVVAKRLDSRYVPGGRSNSWIKVKNVITEDLVIGGWLPGEGRRADRLGALLVGLHEDGALRYCGRVGTGFTEKTLRELTAKLREISAERSPFEAGRAPPKEAVFVEPKLTARVEFREWTNARTLRAPSFKGLVEP